MRILLDECVPRRLKRAFGEHDVWTVSEMGWAGTKDGALLRIAADHFDVLLTTDRNLIFQQNLTTVRLGILVLHASSNDIAVLQLLMPAVHQALQQMRAGEVRHVHFVGQGT